MGDALTDLLAVPALLRLKERADAGAEQAMVLFADIASGRMSYIDFQLRSCMRALRACVCTEEDISGFMNVIQL